MKEPDAWIDVVPETLRLELVRRAGLGPECATMAWKEIPGIGTEKIRRIVRSSQNMCEVVTAIIDDIRGADERPQG